MKKLIYLISILLCIIALFYIDENKYTFSDIKDIFANCCNRNSYAYTIKVTYINGNIDTLKFEEKPIAASSCIYLKTSKTSLPSLVSTTGSGTLACGVRKYKIISKIVTN